MNGDPSSSSALSSLWQQIRAVLDACQAANVPKVDLVTAIAKK